jgi:transcriptional regulator with XRE-family HTH domain
LEATRVESAETSSSSRRAALGERLRQLRAHSGLAPAEIAAWVGVDPVFYADLETGHADLGQLTAEHLDALAAALDVDVVGLLQGVTVSENARTLPASAASAVEEPEPGLWLVDDVTVEVDRRHPGPAGTPEIVVRLPPDGADDLARLTVSARPGLSAVLQAAAVTARDPGRASNAAS